MISRCLLVHNVAGDTFASTRRSYWVDGGAIDVIYRGAPIIRDNRITRNFASHTGGGIHFDDGTSGLVENNIIEHNENNGCYGGGGLALVGGAHPVIVGNRITYNVARYYWKGGFGGGIICLNANPAILHNTIAYNSTVNGDSIGVGGGIKGFSAPQAGTNFDGDPLFLDTPPRDGEASPGLEPSRNRLEGIRFIGTPLPLGYLPWTGPSTVALVRLFAVDGAVHGHLG